MKTSLIPILALVASASFGCVVVPPPPPAAPAPVAAPAAAAPAAAPAPVVATPVVAAPVPTTLAIRSECASASALWIGVGGGKPGSAGGHHTQVNPTGSISEPRQNGLLTVWLLNTNGAPMAKVDALTTTRDVVIDKGCATFRAE